MKRIYAFLLAAMFLTTFSVYDRGQAETTQNITQELHLTAEAKPATVQTALVNSAVYSMLDFGNTQEAQFAVKGLIDAPEKLELTDAAGNVIWSQEAFSFLADHEKSPDTANPSLWENTKNNHAYGLFEVIDGIYQVRGYDMANLTLIAGDTGWIVFDPLMSVECTQAAMALVEKNLGKRPVTAVIISHPHIDHFGGIRGVMSPEQAADGKLAINEQIQSGKIPIIVPEGFTQYAMTENLYMGQAMNRRANYQYGKLLEPSVTGTLAMGIGIGQSKGTISFITPTYEINKTGTVLTIDGVVMEFQITPGTEAAAEMNTWFPEKKALWVAENCTATLHNLYTLRGAQVRDGNIWAQYIMEAVSRYGSEVELTFQSHNWPHWGNSFVNEYLINTAAVYKFINDQTLTYINQGYTSDEISNMIKLPDTLAANWYTRQYYGTVAHDAKAVYQKYMGWYDANPVHLNPLSPEDSAKKWVEYLGDEDEVLRKAMLDYEKGEYQWVAQITNVLVFADPDNTAARLLCADAMEQMGYQAESGAWRNAYLTAALELRRNNITQDSPSGMSTGDILTNLTPEMIFDYMGLLLDKQAMGSYNFTVRVTLSDELQVFTLIFRNGPLLYFEGTLPKEPDLSLTCPKSALLYIIARNDAGIKKTIQMQGDVSLMALIVKNLNQLVPGKPANFNIIEP